MLKETVRPLLVDNLEKLKAQEAYSEREVKTSEPGWEPAALVLERWRAARLKRAEAELQLWLADQQWEREEKEERAREWTSPLPVSSPSSKDKPAE